MTKPPSPGEPDPPPQAAGRLQRMQRLLGYAGWTFAAAALPLALDRLVIHPALSHHLGEIRFSALVWVLALINIVGLVGYNGFALLLMRDFASKPAEDGMRMFRTAMTLTGVLTLVIIALTCVIAWPWMPAEAQAEAAPLLVGFGAFGLIRAISMVLVTHLRITRRFRWIFTLRLVEAMVLLANLAMASRQSMWIISLIYVASVLIPLPLGVRAARDVVGGGSWWSGSQAKYLMAGWVSGAGISLIDQAQVYAPRILLGVLGEDLTDVGALYAATAIGMIFIFPVQMISQLVLSLLGGKTKFVLGDRRGWQYLLLTLVFSIAVGLLTYLLGRVLVGVLYPDQAEVALGLFYLIAICNGLLAIKQMVRPVLLKYASLNVAMVCSGIALVVQLIAVVVLVPRYQATGAAMSMAVAALAGAFIWLAYFLYVHRKLS